MNDAASWIFRLRLAPHPEGGYFSETYKSADIIPAVGLPARYDSERAACTAIYFLLRAGEVSKFHRLHSDELWFYHAGCSLTVFILQPDGSLLARHVGPDFDRQEQLQVLMPHGVWFAARPNTDTAGDYTLVSCVVAPGFEFRDFELADRADLLAAYPQYGGLIRHLT